MRRLGVPLGLFVLAFAVRMLPWATVFERGGSQFTGNDAYYHMRRVLYGLEHFPDWLDFDPYLNFPHGARPIWTPVFDWLSTLFVLPFHALAGLAGAEWAAATIPPLLGAGCVVALYFAARELFDECTATIAAGLLTLTSAHVWYSSAGFFDHHAAVALTAAWMLWAAIRFVRAEAPTPRTSLALSVSQAAALLLWPGMLLHVARVELGILAQAARDRGTGSERLRVRALGHVFALAMVAPLCLGQSWTQWGDYAPTVLSRFQPWLFAALAVHAAACAALWRSRGDESFASRARSSLGIALTTAALSALLLPGLLDSAPEAWRWLGKQEQFQSHVIESRGILIRSDGPSLDLLLRNLSLFGLLLPVSLAAFVWTSRARADWDARLLAAIWSAGLVLATFQQRRFGNSAALGVALVSAWAIREVWLGAIARSHGRVWLAHAGVALGIVLALAPTLRPRLQPLRYSIDRLSGRPLQLGTYLMGKRLMLDAGNWLRENAGHDLDFTHPQTTPDHGLMAPWHLGHRLLYSSRLPTVVGNFGDDLGKENFARYRGYMRSAEPQAATRLDHVRARFVVVESLDDDARDRLGPRTMLRRLTASPLADLAFHRLRYATRVPPGRPHVRSYRVFERVAGAEVVGFALPGAAVDARMRVRAGKRGILLLHTTSADEDGIYRLRLAQASADGVPQRWQLLSGDRESDLEVALDDVLAGRELAGPDLR